MLLICSSYLRMSSLNSIRKVSLYFILNDNLLEHQNEQLQKEKKFS
jgi:hypothetical protein